MTAPDAAIEVRVLERIADVSRSEWDACAGGDNPFLLHDFLDALEQSGSVSADEGWLPRHLAAYDDAGRLAAAMPLYLKGHSQGEYVFDHSWAHAWERAGGRYYPKLLSAVPFTPVTGRRMLVRDADARPLYEAALAEAMLKLVENSGVSSLHVNFLTAVESERLAGFGFLQRSGQQYHWRNEGYSTFQDFLDALSSRKRKNIRKERQAVVDQGVVMRVLTGADLKTEHWDAFYRFYRNTTDRKWGWDYLKRPFFSLLHERMADRVALVMAEHDGEWVAGALNLIGGDTLYGRNWGCTAQFKNLHFEACYYQAIDFAIERGLARVEAGAQGQHKIQRGYLPVETSSAHFIPDPSFRRAVADFLEREREAVGEEIAFLADNLSPFRKSE
ncbi:MAG: GNAT family N-acetyltransferase [Alphaproteobacteria bacterium]